MNILSGNFPPRGGGRVMRISFGADIQDMRPRINHFLVNKMDCAVGEKQQINKDVERCNL